jgi:hypothetical protein
MRRRQFIAALSVMGFAPAATTAEPDAVNDFRIRHRWVKPYVTWHTHDSAERQ